jgi:hypothetical protein
MRHARADPASDVHPPPPPPEGPRYLSFCLSFSVVLYLHRLLRRALRATTTTHHRADPPAPPPTVAAGEAWRTALPDDRPRLRPSLALHFLSEATKDTPRNNCYDFAVIRGLIM